MASQYRGHTVTVDGRGYQTIAPLAQVQVPVTSQHQRGGVPLDNITANSESLYGYM